MKYLPFLLFVFVLLSSCEKESYSYKATSEAPERGLSYTDTLRFEMDVQDTVKFHKLVLDVNYKDVYPYQNMYVKIITEKPNDNPIEQVISLQLAEESGKWIGECNNGECVTSISLKEKVRFDKLGLHTFKFVQNTRREVVDEVLSMTLKLQDVIELVEK